MLWAMSSTDRDDAPQPAPDSLDDITCDFGDLSAVESEQAPRPRAIYTRAGVLVDVREP